MMRWEVPTVVIFQNCKTCLWVTLLLFRDPFLTSLHKYSPVQRFNCTAVLIWVSGGVFLCKLNRCQFGCQWFTDITQSQRSYSPWYESTMQLKRLLFKSIWGLFFITFYLFNSRQSWDKWGWWNITFYLPGTLVFQWFGTILSCRC